MIYKILALTDKNTDIAFDYANRILKSIESKFEREFRFDNVGFAENNKSVIEKAKASDAVLIFGDINKLLIRELCKELSLHTRVCRIGDSTVVTDELSGIYSGEQGFRSNPKFGREAYDTECYSELEIERTARIAYELQNIRSFILADKADELATSKLWRKIVTDINEDYPYINVELQYVENTVAELAENNITGTILTPQIFSDILINIIKAKSQRQGFSALLGDTALGAFHMTNANGAQLTPLQCREILCAAEFMLRHSFDMQSEADCIKAALAKAAVSDADFAEKALSTI